LKRQSITLIIRTGLQVAIPSSCSGATPVQPRYQNMENMDTVDKTTPRYGTRWTLYHRMYWVDTNYCHFESVGSS